MITRTFSFLNNFSDYTEQKLRRLGVHCWDDFLKQDSIHFISGSRKAHYDSELTKAKKNLDKLNHFYFSDTVPQREHWRLYERFKDHCCYVDIETTGLSAHADEITTVSIWDGNEVKTFINGIDLDLKSLRQELYKHKMIVTFNGRTFDLPFIQQKFPMPLSHLHMDLRWDCRKVGLVGGLKRIEQQLGISRPDDVKDVNGMMAVRLWYKWKLRGNQDALDMLVKYNQEDVINLEKMAGIVYDRLCRRESY